MRRQSTARTRRAEAGVCAARGRSGKWNDSTGQFRRDQLPSPLAYYRRVLGITPRGDGWQSARCPFHEDKHASLSVNVTHGGWRCHGCGLSGDLVEFEKQRTGLSFKEAAKGLGAWR